MKNAKQLPTDKMSELFSLLTPYVMENPELSDTYLDFEVGVAPVTLPGPFESLAGKIVFPVRDELGVLCGYAGNTGELLCGSEVLFGLDKAKAAILEKGEAFVVEDCKDVLAMHAAGYTNTVGLCGTTITSAQIALLKKYTIYVKLLPGSNDKGIAGAEVVNETLKKEGFKSLIFNLPEGAVPDTFFRTVDRKYFREIIEQFIHLVCLQERLFIASCICFRDMIVEEEDREFSYISYLYAGMKVDETLPESSVNREIIRLLAEMISPEDFPPELMKEVEHVEKKLLAPFTVLDKLLSKQEKGRHVPGYHIVNILFYQYLENRLKFIVSKLSYQVKHEEAPKIRKSLEELLENYTIDLRFISEALEDVGFSFPDLLVNAFCSMEPEK
ncbi:MAG: toprim domain-containing protein [Tannerellaceae bacterium]|nr:toprim domain-containing protein [Tannerellaceae bacterium]